MAENIETKEIDPYLLSLILSLSATAMTQMGKVMNPSTGKIERDLSHAKFSLETLAMLRTKMIGNLTAREEELLSNTLADLQLNYADEVNRESGSSTVH